MQTMDDRSSHVIALLDECLDITRAHGMAMATKLLLMTQLEIKMQSNSIEDQELAQLCQQLEAWIDDSADSQIHGNFMESGISPAVGSRR